MIEWLTLICQWLILILMIGIVWFSWQARKNVKGLIEVIESYRREIKWLELRLEGLEQGKQSQKATSSK